MALKEFDISILGGAFPLGIVSFDGPNVREYVAAQDELFGSIGIHEPDGRQTSTLARNLKEEPLPPSAIDLVRLHCLARSRKVTTVLEFGVGFSTLVLAHALAMNKQDFEKEVSTRLRRTNSFEIHSVDDSRHWISVAEKRIPKLLDGHVFISYSKVNMTKFGGRVCTEYENIPNVTPDLIYLDGPSQDLVKGEVNGVSTRHPDRLPMASDILKIEHFLLPGTLIVIDGRTANARFLLSNLQRQWWYHHDRLGDVHFLELREPPLGHWNESQLDFCLGQTWRSRFDLPN